jgi:calcineurin-like phosphoesterase family protein
MSKIFVTSDTHAFHERIIEFCPKTRKGSSTEEMTENLVQAHNRVVSPEDTVYFLGDFAFGGRPDKIKNFADRLNGTKHLIYGNHDKVIRGNAVLQSCFASVQDYKRFSYQKQQFVLFHFPIARWEGCHYGAIHLFGHEHGGFEQEGRCMDVGIDTRPNGDMQPWLLDDVIRLLKDKPLIQHHGKTK